MSSIRPLATITVLALVGVFLYAKINETEPPLPEGVEDWSVGTDIDFDMGGADPGAAPQSDTSSSGGEAPAYSATQPATASAPSFNTADASGAPAWTPPPVNAAPSANAAPTANAAPAAEFGAAPTFGSTTNDIADTATPESPDLPPLPSLPAAVSAAPPMETATQSTSEDLTTQTTLPTDIDLDTPPTTASSPSSSTPAQSSLFSATRLAVQSALDRGELSQALLLLSDWYGDPSLSPSEAAEVDSLLGQLAGSVIYSTEPRLEPPYMVQAGERLETIAKQYDVPWQLLAKINGITSADQLQPGQKIKVLRGPFSAVVDMSKKTMTLMLDRRYAGKFTLDIDPSVTIEEGHWEVNQKLLTPANASLPGNTSSGVTEERSLMLSNSSGATQVAVLRGSTAANPLTEPAGRILRMKPADAQDVFDILSLGSKVVIRR